MAEKILTENASGETGGVDFSGLDRAVDNAITEIDRLRETNAHLIATLVMVRDSLRGFVVIPPENFKYEIDWINAAIAKAEGAR